MIGRSRAWLAVAVAFVIGNLAGLWLAVRMGESSHAATHAALLLPGIYLVRRFARSDGRSLGRGGDVGVPDESPALGDRLSRLEQAVDSVAIEVGRMGDAQRLMTQMVTETPPSEADAGQRLRER